MAKKKIAAIYGRKSREKADTLESQINACIQWCERNNVEYEIFSEEGSASSEDWHRPKLQEMISRLKGLEFDLVVVTEQTRICRDDMFPIFKQVMLDNQILFVTADNNSIFDFSNPDDELKSDILQAVGKNELSRTKIRLKRGMVQSAKKGNWVGKKTPIGYDYDKKTKRLKQNKDAEVIKNIFELYMKGMSTKDIAYKFKMENVKTEKEMIWTPAGISRLLNNVVYVGHSLYGRTEQKYLRDEHGSKTKKRKTLKTDEEKQILEENTHEGIVNQEEWDLVQSIKDKRNSRPPSLKLAKHPFSGLIVCADCGAVHSFQSSRGGKKRISSCQTRNYIDLENYTVCENSGSNLEPFEQLFFAWLSKEALKLEKYVDLIESANISKEALEKKKAAAKAAKEKQIEQFKKKANKINSLIEEEYYDEEDEPKKKAEVKQLKSFIKQLENEIKEADAEEAKDEANQAKKILNKMKKIMMGKIEGNITGQEANELLCDFINKIKYKTIGKGKSKEIKIQVFLKSDVQEIMNEIEMTKAS